jgi:hypothetical protein
MMRASSFGSQVMISGPDSRHRVSGSGLWIYFSSYFPANISKGEGFKTGEWKNKKELFLCKKIEKVFVYLLLY